MTPLLTRCERGVFALSSAIARWLCRRAETGRMIEGLVSVAAGSSMGGRLLVGLVSDHGGDAC
jgi:hypothetical protein